VGEERSGVGCVLNHADFPLFFFFFTHPSLIDKRQEKARLEAAAAGSGDPDVVGEHPNAPTAPTRHSTEEMEVDGDAKDRDKDKDKEKEDGAPQSTAPTTAAGKDPHPPSKRYRLTESMKAIVWRLVTLSNECCRLENEKK
jgi:hypothetical protein